MVSDSVQTLGRFHALRQLGQYVGGHHKLGNGDIWEGEQNNNRHGGSHRMAGYPFPGLCPAEPSLLGRRGRRFHRRPEKVAPEQRHQSRHQRQADNQSDGNTYGERPTTGPGHAVL